MNNTNILENITTTTIITSVIDLIIVWYVFYLLITVMRGTKAIQLIKGIFFILIGRGISNAFDLTTTTEIFDTVLEWRFICYFFFFVLSGAHLNSWDEAVFSDLPQTLRVRIMKK